MHIMATPRAILLPGGVVPADITYGPLVEALGAEVRLVTKDLELYAGPDPPVAYTLGSEVAGIERAAQDAGFDHFHLVGFSAGGAASLAFAARNPDRLQSLALIEPAWMGNEDLGPEETADRQEFERIAALPPDQRLAAFAANQLAPGLVVPAATATAPSWMANRPTGLRTLTTTFGSTTLEIDRLRSFERPVYFAIGALSNPRHYAKMAERAQMIFPDFTLDVFAERHHLDPPHWSEPERTAQALRAHWARAA
jgi:pimeloyl-ACP methyl ester carboxylesterase